MNYAWKCDIKLCEMHNMAACGEETIFVVGTILDF